MINEDGNIKHSKRVRALRAEEISQFDYVQEGEEQRKKKYKPLVDHIIGEEEQDPFDAIQDPYEPENE